MENKRLTSSDNLFVLDKAVKAETKENLILYKTLNSGTSLTTDEHGMYKSVLKQINKALLSGIQVSILITPNKPWTLLNVRIGNGAIQQLSKKKILTRDLQYYV